MKRGGPKNIVASVQARLVERSRALGVEHQLTLARFAGERLLYRLSASAFADRFIVKGAALLVIWLGEPIRPTKDVELLGFGETSAEALRRVFAAICSIDAADDGLTFLADSIQVEPIREDQEYGGMRVKLMAMLGNVRIPLQVDVGAGDAVVPPPELREFPGLLDLPRATVRMYRPETSIAEKTEAMVRLRASVWPCRNVYIPNATTPRASAESWPLLSDTPTLLLRVFGSAWRASRLPSVPSALRGLDPRHALPMCWATIGASAESGAGCRTLHI